MWDLIDKFGTILGIGGAMVAGWQSYNLRQETQRNWLETERQRQKDNELIKITLRSDHKQIQLPIELERSNLSRSEILGFIGMLPMKQKGARFGIKYLSVKDFGELICRVRDADGVFELVIKCNDSEIEQFDYETTPI